MSSPVSKQRLAVLDHLRGFFIVVIIIDHFSRWPSIWAVLTGKAWLWVTAAEGFVAISGLLVGYVRGFKNRHLPFKDVSGKLIRRGLVLYLWAIIATIAYTTIIWYVPLQGGAPSPPIEQGNWQALVFQAVTLQYTNVWIYFLGLYAIFLVVSPIAIWLFRQNKAWLVAVLSSGGLILSWVIPSEALQWQFLFFMPSIAGYYLESILAWWKKLARRSRRLLEGTIVSLMLMTIALSVVATFYAFLIPGVAPTPNALFDKEIISVWRAITAFLWFTGFIFIFHYFHRFISRFAGWLLIPIGTHSLTAYIVHGAVLCLISALTVGGDNIITNSLLGALAVITVWAILKIPHINRVIPR